MFDWRKNDLPEWALEIPQNITQKWHRPSNAITHYRWCWHYFFSSILVSCLIKNEYLYSIISTNPHALSNERRGRQKNIRHRIGYAIFLLCANETKRYEIWGYRHTATYSQPIRKQLEYESYFCHDNPGTQYVVIRFPIVPLMKTNKFFTIFHSKFGDNSIRISNIAAVPSPFQFAFHKYFAILLAAPNIIINNM